MSRLRFGFRYADGKVHIFRANDDGRFNSNPGTRVPDWSVDIREIIAMCFAGASGLAFIFVGKHDYAMVIASSLLSYATGRTIGSRTVVYAKGEK
jgi:hypothetical protein